MGLTLALIATQAEALDVGGLNLGVGGKIGLNMNKASAGSTASAKYGFGWTLGAVTMLDLDVAVIEFGLQYSERKHDFNNLLGSSGDFAATLKQLEIPLLGYYKLNVMEGADLRFGAGLQFEMGLGKVKGGSGSISYSDAGIKKTGYSLLLDVGGNYKLSESDTLTADIRYGMGLSDRKDSSGLFGEKFKTSNIELQVGYLF